jgi:hypothetical protein
LQLAADRRTPQIELAVQLADQDQHATVVDRAWVQTWLTPSARQDRAVFCFTSSRKELPVVLPAGTATGQVDLQLDGRPIEGRATGDGWLLVPLTGEVGQRHILEVRSHFAAHTHQPGSLSIELPRLGSDAWVRRMYWQLVLPRNEHLLAASGGLTTEFTWGWQGWFFGRRPLLEQDELEEWAGVTRRASLPMGTNQYLLSSLGNVEQGDVYTASRAWIVLMASGAALVAGLLLIYVPASRHPATLFAAAVVLLCLGLLYPEPMLLVSQAAILGLGLALLAGLLRRSLRRRRMVLPERASSVVERGSTPTHRPPAPSGSQPSTQAAAGLAAAPPDASP